MDPGLDHDRNELEVENAALRRYLTSLGDIALAGEVPLEDLLQRIVEAAQGLLRARYAALGVTDARGRVTRFYTAGMSAEERAAIGALPIGVGLLGLIVREKRVIRIARIAAHPASVGFPPDHPPMNSFLGGPIMRGPVVYGNLYLTERIGASEFSPADEELLAILSTQAATAIENAQRFVQLREVDQLKANIISLVSHELRTPLSHIKGYASTLLQPDVEWDAATQREFVGSIERQADRLARLITDILEISRLDAGGTALLEVAPVSPAVLVERGLRQAAPNAASHPIQTRIEPGLPLVSADVSHVERVLSNLIENAAKYSGPEAPIAIEVGLHEDGVVFAVRDQGTGLTEEEMRHLFERFYRSPRVKHRTPGTGLGLAICREIVQAHGGTIWAESIEDGGSVFRFTLRFAE